MPIGTLIKTIQDIMRKDVGVDGDAQRISQIVWLLFLKIFNDREEEWQLTIPDYKTPLQSRYRWQSWAKDPEGVTGEELIDFVNNELFPSLKRLAYVAGVSPHGRVIGSVFEDAYNYMKSGTLLRQVINTIEEEVDFNSSSDRHLFNDIYEKILADLQSAGNAGEYYPESRIKRTLFAGHSQIFQEQPVSGYRFGRPTVVAHGCLHLGRLNAVKPVQNLGE